MEKRILLQISTSITPKMVDMIGEMEKEGIIVDGYICYDEKEEPKVSQILSKYMV